MGVDSLSDNSSSCAFMIFALACKLYFNSNVYLLLCLRISICMQEYVYIYLFGALKSMKWLLWRMEWSS